MLSFHFNSACRKNPGKRMLLWMCVIILSVSGISFPLSAHADFALPVTGMTVSDSYAGGPYYQKLIDAMYDSVGVSPAQRFINIAKSQMGYTGMTYSGDYSGNGNGGIYTEYSRHRNCSGLDWCAAFVSWCAEAAGIPESAMPRHNRAKFLGGNASAGTFRRAWSDDFVNARTDYEPQPGDLCLWMPIHDYDRDLDKDTRTDIKGCDKSFNSWRLSAHVAIVETVSRNSDNSYTITTIERRSGNTVNSRSLNTFSKHTAEKTCQCGYNEGADSARVIQGFLHPDWSKASVWTDSDLPSRDPLNLGDSFDAHIIFKHPWRLAVVNSATNNVEIGDELRRAVEDWHFERQSDGSYIIESLYNGMVLDVDGANPSNATNVQVYQRWGVNNAAQKWYIFSCSDGYRLSPKIALNRSFDASGGDFATGRNIHIYDSNNTDAQVVWFYLLDYPVLTSVTVPKTVTLRSSDQYDLNVAYSPSDVWYSCMGIYFSSSDPEVATVSSGGRIHALQPGTATIRATSAYNDLIYDECKVTVTLPFSANQPTMPKELKAVEAEAFAGTRLWTAVLPSGCTKIGNRAFAGSDLRYIFIPDSVTVFGQDIFADGRTDLTIFCYSKSAAETYAKQNSIDYFILSK